MLKKILQFILVEERLDHFFLHLMWVGPIIGAVLGAFAGLLFKSFKKMSCCGTGLGFLGTLLGIFWLVYNQVINHYGLDSVKGLFINLAIFSCLGLACGLVFKKWNPFKTSHPTSTKTEKTAHQDT